MGYTLISRGSQGLTAPPPGADNPPIPTGRFRLISRGNGANTFTVNGPDGLKVNFPQGTDKATVNRVMAEAHQRHQSAFAAQNGALPVSGGTQASNLAQKGSIDNGQFTQQHNNGGLAVLQGVALNGADEILSGIAAPFQALQNRLGVNQQAGFLPSVSENYQQTLANLRAQQADMEANNPKTTLALELAGGLATGKLPAGVALKGGGIIAKTAKAIGTGAAYGGIAGLNDGTDMDSRLQNAGTGAAIGGIVGGAALPVAKAIGAGYSTVTNKLANRALGAELGVGSKAAKGVLNAYAQDAATGLNPTDAADLLLNRGNALRGQAEEIASQTGQGRNVLIKAIDSQRQGTGQRTQAAIDAALGKDAGRVVNASAIDTERKAAGQMFNYARLHQGRFDVQPLAQTLDGMIAEADGGVRAALVRARNLQVFKTGPQGANAVQLHAARMALDDLLAKPGLGRNAARMLRDVRGQIDETLKAHVPGMREADAAFSGVMQKQDALQAGRDVFTRSYGSPQELLSEMQQMAPAARAEFLKGARDSVAEIMGTARNDVAAARRELLDKGWNKEKLALLIGRDRAAILERQLVSEGNRTDAANSIVAKARVSAQEEAAKAFPGADRKRNLSSVSATGLALQSGNWVLNKLTGARRAELSRQAATLLSRRASQVEPILQQAARRAGRRLNVKEQIEAVSNALALSSSQQMNGALR